MVVLQAPAARLQHFHRLLAGKLAHQDRLEAALERRVPLDPPLVLGRRRRADHPHVLAHQSRLQHVRRVHRDAHRRALPDQVVHLVHEEDHVGVVRHRLDEPPHPLLVLAAVHRAGEECHVIQGDDANVAQRRRHVSRDDALREPFRERGLADAGRAHQRGVVLGLPEQDVDDARDLGVAAPHRLEVTAAGRGVEVVAEAGEDVAPRAFGGAGKCVGHKWVTLPRPSHRGFIASPPREGTRPRAGRRPREQLHRPSRGTPRRGPRGSARAGATKAGRRGCRRDCRGTG